MRNGRKLGNAKPLAAGLGCTPDEFRARLAAKQAAKAEAKATKVYPMVGGYELITHTAHR